MSKTVFHRPEWREFLSEIMRGKDETVDGLPVFRGESLPLADYCGPSRQMKVPGGIEIFSLKKIPAGNKSPFVTFRLNVKGKKFDEILTKKIHQKHRNMVNRAVREGIQVYKFEKDEAHLREYYRLYVGTMLKLSRVPLPMKAFEVLARVFEKEAELYLAQYQGEFIGGLFVFVAGGRMHIWGNASERKFGRFGVNNALYAFAIERACELGLSEVDFGSTMKDSSHHFFKERWGGKEMPIYYRGDKEFGGGPSLAEKIVTFGMRLMPVGCVSFLSKILHKIR